MSRRTPTAAARRAALAVIAVVACLVAVGAAQAQTRTYTTSTDFAAGTSLRVESVSVPDQLQLGSSTHTVSLLWVPASSRGTIVRLDPATGVVLGEYRTAPQGHAHDPSRTAVDALGNVWVGNRAEAADGRGSVVQVGVVAGGTRVRREADGSVTLDPNGGWVAPPYDHCTCVDRNGDGLIRTSRGLQNILAWPDAQDGAADGDAVVRDAEDECIRLFQRTSAPRTHQVSLAPSGDVWVGSFPGAVFDRLDGSTGAILQTVVLPAGGWGGVVDAQGVLWSAGFDANRIVRYDPMTGATMTNVLWSYGMTADASGNIWNTMWTNNTIAKFDPSGALVSGFPRPTFGGGASGVVLTSDGDVWVANANTNQVSRLSPTATLRKRINVGQAPHGIAQDAAGMLWVVNKNSNSVQRIDPHGGSDGLGAVDRTVALGNGAVPQAYCAMTGTATGHRLEVDGTWTVVADGARPGVNWSSVSWTSTEPPGTSVTVAVRAAEETSDLPSRAWLPASAGGDLGAAARGRYVEIRVTLARQPATDRSPVLHDLAVTANRAPDCSQAQPSIAQIWPPNHRTVPVEILGFTDPDGDPVTCTITRITQDEPVRGGGSGDTGPDGGGIGTASAWVRAERTGGTQGSENGRVYEIHFRVTDAGGATCEGSVEVCVAHDRGHGGCIDDGQAYDSTADPRLLVKQFPNPFNPTTTISYVLSSASPVRLVVYDALGHQVRQLVGSAQAAGLQRVLWDGRDGYGHAVASGVYVWRLDAGPTRETGRMLLVK